MKGIALADAARDDALFAEIKQALLQYKMLFACDQPISDAEDGAFARKSCELENQPVTTSSEPGIIHIGKTLDSPSERYENAWHTDATLRDISPMVAALRCVECQPVNGDAMWSNMELRTFATTSPKRLGLMPEVPTYAELVYKDVTEVAWVGLFTAPDMASAIQMKVTEGTQNALQVPRQHEVLANLGIDVGGNATPDEMMANLRTASDKQPAMPQASGFRPEQGGAPRPEVRQDQRPAGDSFAGDRTLLWR